MSEVPETGSPFIFATRSAAVGDRDRRRHLSDGDRGDPAFPGEVETVDIILSVDYARHVIAQLAGAVSAATNDEAPLRASGT